MARLDFERKIGTRGMDFGQVVACVEAFGMIVGDIKMTKWTREDGPKV